jgi:hypothetical protein
MNDDFSDIPHQKFADDDTASVMGVDDTENEVLQEEVAALKVQLEDAQEQIKRSTEQNTKLEQRQTHRAYGMGQIVELSRKYAEPGRINTPEGSAFPLQPAEGSSSTWSKWYRYVNHGFARFKMNGPKINELYKKFVAPDLPGSTEEVLDGLSKRLEFLSALEQKATTPQRSELLLDVALTTYANEVMVEAQINQVATTLGQMTSGVVSIVHITSDFEKMANNISSLGVQLCTTLPAQAAVESLIEAEGGVDYDTMTAALSLLENDMRLYTPQTAPALRTSFIALLDSLSSETEAQIGMIENSSENSTDNIQILKKKIPHAIAFSKQQTPGFDALTTPVKVDTNTALPALRSSMTTQHWSWRLKGAYLPYMFDKQTGVLELKLQGHS